MPTTMGFARTAKHVAHRIHRMVDGRRTTSTSDEDGGFQKVPKIRSQHRLEAIPHVMADAGVSAPAQACRPDPGARKTACRA